MAEGSAEDDVLDDRNGSFQNQSEEASTSKRSSREGRRKLCDFLVLPLIGSEKNRFDCPNQHPRHHSQP